MTNATFNLENLGLTITFPRSIIRGRFSSLETYAIWQAQSFLKHGRCEDGCVAVLNVAEGITDADKRGERAGEMDDQIIERLIAEDTARHKTPTMPITGSAPPASAPVDSEWPKYLVGFDAQGDRTIFVYRSDDNGVTFYRDGEFKAAHWNYAHNLHRTDMRVADTAEAMRVAKVFKAGSAEHGMGMVVDTPKWLVSWLRKYAPAIEAKTPDKPAPYAPQGHGSKPERPWVTREEWLESVRAAGAVAVWVNSVEALADLIRHPAYGVDNREPTS